MHVRFFIVRSAGRGWGKESLGGSLVVACRFVYILFSSTFFRFPNIFRSSLVISTSTFLLNSADSGDAASELLRFSAENGGRSSFP